VQLDGFFGRDGLGPASAYQLVARVQVSTFKELIREFLCVVGATQAETDFLSFDAYGFFLDFSLERSYSAFMMTTLVVGCFALKFILC
jgi:hypothetical protein